MKKLTITVDDDVYKGLHAHIGRGNISRFLNDIARSHVIEDDIEAGYAVMAADQDRERDAEMWSHISIQDMHDDAR